MSNISSSPSSSPPVAADLCVENPCMNGGTCVDGGTLVCVCLPGYGGDFCQTGWLHPFIIIIIMAVPVTPSRSCSCPRPGGVRARLGQVSGLLLPSLQQQAELGRRGAALPHLWGSPAVGDDPRGTAARQRSTIANVHATLCLRPPQQLCPAFSEKYREYQWIGLNDRTIEGDFRWSDGSPLVRSLPLHSLFRVPKVCNEDVSSLSSMRTGTKVNPTVTSCLGRTVQ